MKIFWTLLILNLGTIALVNGKPTVSDEYYDTTPGSTITINCPDHDGSSVYLYATEEAKTIPELNDNNLISYTGFIVLSSVTEDDSKMYVCRYPGKKIPPLKIHLRVMDKSKYKYPQLIDKPRFRFPIVRAAAAARQRKQARRQRHRAESAVSTTSATEAAINAAATDPAANPDSPPGARPDELSEYQKRSELRKSLFPPSKPEILKVNDTSIQVKWTINLMKKYPVSYFMIQYLDKKGEEVLGGANAVHDVAKVPSILYWHNFDNLVPGHSYQFRVGAIYKVPDEISVLSKRSDWVDIK